MKTDRVIDLLEAADWKTIIFKLTRYAFWMAGKYAWRSGKIDQLPGGKTPEDIACEAVEKVWKGTRNWDPDKYPDLLVHLKWIVKSDMEHLFSSAEHKKSSGMLESRYGEETQVNWIENLSDLSFPIHGKISTPEEGVDEREKKAYEEKLLKEFRDRIKGDEDLELLLICFEEGIDKPEEIAKQTGWEISKVYNLKRKISRKAADIFKNNPKGE